MVPIAPYFHRVVANCTLALWIFVFLVIITITFVFINLTFAAPSIVTIIFVLSIFAGVFIDRVTFIFISLLILNLCAFPDSGLNLPTCLELIVIFRLLIIHLLRNHVYFKINLVNQILTHLFEYLTLFLIILLGSNHFNIMLELSKI